MTPLLTAGWLLWFAWYPVYVDAYSVDQIKNGQFRYRVWLRLFNINGMSGPTMKLARRTLSGVTA